MASSIVTVSVIDAWKEGTTVDATKPCKVVSDVDESAFFPAAHFGAPDASPDHLAVEDDRGRRSCDHDGSHPRCIEARRQYAKVEQ